jgi:hypothetical protein
LTAISLWAVLRSNSPLTGVAGDPSNSLAAGIEFVRRIPEYLFSAAVDDDFRAAGEQLPGLFLFRYRFRPRLLYDAADLRGIIRLLLTCSYLPFSAYCPHTDQ